MKLRNYSRNYSRAPDFSGIKMFSCEHIQFMQIVPSSIEEKNENFMRVSCLSYPIEIVVKNTRFCTSVLVSLIWAPTAPASSLARDSPSPDPLHCRFEFWRHLPGKSGQTLFQLLLPHTYACIHNPYPAVLALSLQFDFTASSLYFRALSSKINRSCFSLLITNCPDRA